MGVWGGGHRGGQNGTKFLLNWLFCQKQTKRCFFILLFNGADNCLILDTQGISKLAFFVQMAQGGPTSYKFVQKVPKMAPNSQKWPPTKKNLQNPKISNLKAPKCTYCQTEIQNWVFVFIEAFPSHFGPENTKKWANLTTSLRVILNTRKKMNQILKSA